MAPPPSPPLTQPIESYSPAVVAQQQILAKQLHELKSLRIDMQGMYDASQQDLTDARADASEAKAVAARERDRTAAVAAENTGLRQWNERLAAELKALREELASGSSDFGLHDEREEEEAAQLMASAAHAAVVSAPPAAPETTGVSIDVAVLQQVQLEASATALRLTHAHARLKRRGKELRASGERITQLQQTAQALSSDLAAATAQIGKLESRIRTEADTSRQLENRTAEHAALALQLERTSNSLSRAKEEGTALVHGPVRTPRHRPNPNANASTRTRTRAHGHAAAHTRI
jgi:DNA repair exonuclease SbcCD ATPase subunit